MVIQNIFTKYLEIHPDEAEDLRLLSDQLAQPANILSRKNFVGHITASAFVINEHTKQVLLLENITLSKLLQPGGHVESSDDSILDAAQREVREETGFKRYELTLRSAVPQDPDVPFDIDTHHIPANDKKNEPEHYHHDFRYIYTTKKGNVETDPSESSMHKWVGWEDFIDMPFFMDIADKISAILEPSPREFFRSISGANSQQIALLAVSHIIPSSEDYIKSLQENFNLIGIIPKPKSVNQATSERLKTSGVVILNQFTRDRLNEDPAELIEQLKQLNDICLIDIGGYFSKSLNQLAEELGGKLLGVVEDTENGHQKYENSIISKTRVVSVARSPLKSFEDQLIGHGIAHATETVLRQINTLITYKNCGIIGYGKIGRGIAEYLQQRGVRPRVSEINALRSIQASCDGSIICSTDDLIEKCDVIFCATGSKALDLVKLRNLRNGAFLASATSSEDEFDLTTLTEEYEKQDIGHDITRYSKRGHKFHLLNDGNAVNFLFAGAVDKYIGLVQGELMYSASKLGRKHDGAYVDGIQVNTLEEQENIARVWLDYVMRNHDPS